MRHVCFAKLAREVKGKKQQWAGRVAHGERQGEVGRQAGQAPEGQPRSARRYASSAAVAATCGRLRSREARHSCAAP